ncbi:MAG: hypothetical protein B7Y36_19065 [Novosphingobium sp. 28-62-57]|nr:MAG: hypothetical protein B7Y36_19065 [Novosphingobium sp. 28-62-57]
MKVAAAIIATLLALVAVLLVQIHGLPIIGGGWKPRALTAERTIADIRKAQAEAEALQAAINAEPMLKSQTIARISDATAKPYLDLVRRAGADRVQPTPQCARGPTDLPGTDRAALGDVEDAGPAGVVPDSVTVVRADWDQLTTAAGQAAMCARAGQALIASGVAVASPETEGN